mgnify:CR=1 FL=1
MLIARNRPRRISGYKAACADSRLPVSYTHLRAHETVLDLVCRLLLEKKKNDTNKTNSQVTLDLTYEYTNTKHHTRSISTRH